MSALDPRSLSFSQAHGYEALPQQLRLEELSEKARVRFWNVLFSASGGRVGVGYPGAWQEIFMSIYTDFLNKPLDRKISERVALSRPFDEFLKSTILNLSFNAVFDLLLAVMRHKRCPTTTISQVAEVFQNFQLAYVLDVGPPPTIYPATTPEEGSAVVEALDQLRSAGLAAPREHLQTAAANINKQDWAGSVRESIHAVESVARQIAQQAKTLSEALKVLSEKRLLEHPALRDGFNKIYGYTNDEQGIRHALLDDDKSNVGREEAVFMLGACASFASYLCRKRLLLGNQDQG